MMAARTEKKSAKDTYQTYYLELIKVLPVKLVVQKLFGKKLISQDKKERCLEISRSEDSAAYLLDKVIYPSLDIGYNNQFDEMLVIMRDSDDPTARHLAATILGDGGYRLSEIKCDQQHKIEQGRLSDDPCGIKPRKEHAKKIAPIIASEWEDICVDLLSTNDRDIVKQDLKHDGVVKQAARMLEVWIERERPGDYQRLKTALEENQLLGTLDKVKDALHELKR